MLFWLHVRALEWFVAQWPFVVAGAIAVMGVAAWVERLKRVQELELKVRQLQRQELDQDRRIIIPTSSEIERYGIASRSQLRRVLNKPELLLGILAILGPIVAAIYQQYRVNEKIKVIDAQVAQKVKAIDVQIVEVQQEISDIDDRLNSANRALGQATAQLEAEANGTGGSGRLGIGPIYKERLAIRDQVAAEVDNLMKVKERAEARRRILEDKRRHLI